MIKRTFHCDCCGCSYTEKGFGAGAPGWCSINGVALDGVPDPFMCPDCKAEIMDFICKVKERKELKDGDVD